MTRLRPRMLDEFQRRNYSPHTGRSYMHAVEEFAEYFTGRRTSLGRTISASIRFICFATASSRRAPSKARPQLCGFCSSRRLDDPICPIRFRFPSATSACPPC